MEYNDLAHLAREKKISINSIAEKMGISRQWLRQSIVDRSMSEDKIEMLCNLLEITPNEFFGWSEEDKGTIVAHHIGGNNEQNGGAALAILSAQLKEKDSQIKDLLTILKTGK